MVWQPQLLRFRRRKLACQAVALRCARLRAGDGDFGVAAFAFAALRRRLVEAGGVEPPSA